MSRRLPKLTSPSANTTTTDIASLQDKLLKSLNSVFEPTAYSKSDENFLSTTDYTAETSSATDKYFEEEYKNPYQALAEKAKTYVKQKETENLKNPKKTPVTTAPKKNPDTFLITSVGIEGNVRKSEPSSEEEDNAENKDSLPDIDYKEVLGSVREAGEYDDLAELRKMIKDTKREMKDYGKELMDLKNVIADMNDFAFKELGYSANQDLMRNMEAAINDLGGKNSFKYMKKSQSSRQNLKMPISSGSGSEKPAVPKTTGKSLTKPSTSNILESRSIRAGGAGGMSGMSGGIRNFGIKKL